MRATARRLRRAPYVVTAIVVSTGALIACNGGPSRETQDYCASLAEQQVLLVMPVATANDVSPAVDRYLEMARRAPLVVQEPWRRLAALMQAAATIDISDATARLDVIQQAYETKADADLIVAHAQTTCSVTIDISGTTTTTTTTTASTIATTVAPTPPVSDPPATPPAAPQTAALAPETPPATPTSAIAPVASGG
jgi:hypothetical protein